MAVHCGCVVAVQWQCSGSAQRLCSGSTVAVHRGCVVAVRWQCKGGSVCNDYTEEEGWSRKGVVDESNKTRSFFPLKNADAQCSVNVLEIFGGNELVFKLRVVGLFVGPKSECFP